VDTLFQQLLQELRKGNVALVVGFGPSVEAGLPGWSDLVQPLAREIGYQGDDPLQTLEFYQNVNGRRALIAYLKDRLEGSIVEPSRSHYLLLQLPVTALLTTAYDDLIQQAARQMGKHANSIVGDVAINYWDESQLNLVRLHGALDQPTSLVITSRDFNALYKNMPPCVRQLFSMLSTRTFLFVGYSPSDPDFVRLYSELTSAEDMHRRASYIVITTSDPLLIEDFQRRRFHVIVLDDHQQKEEKMLSDWLTKLLQALTEPKDSPVDVETSRPFRNALRQRLGIGGRDIGASGERSPQGRDIQGTPRYFLPAHNKIFLARQNELSLLINFIAEKQITLITGMAGVGKTVLATEVAYNFKDKSHFLDGITWHTCNNRVGEVGLAHVLDEIAEYLADYVSIREEPVEQKKITLQRLLAARKALIILDNVEPGFPLDELFGLLGENKLLLTSRAKLLPRSHTLYLDVLSLDESITFFKALITREILPSEYDALRSTCDLLGGLPLAIDLAAAYLTWGEYPLEDLYERLLRQPVDWLQRLPGVLEDTKGDSIKASFSLSWEKLNLDQKQVFGTMGLFATNTIAPEFVGESSGVDSYEQALHTLVGLSLLQLDVTPTDVHRRPRYRLHPLLRSFASLQLASRPEWKAIERRFMLFCKKYIESHNDDTTLLGIDVDNFLAAFSSAAQSGDDRLVVDLAMLLAYHLRLLGYHTRGRWVLSQGVVAARKLSDHRSEAKILQMLAHLCYLQDDYKEAENHYEQSNTIWNSLGDYSEVGNTLHQLGVLAYHQSGYANAIEFYNKSLMIRTADQIREKAATLHAVGVLAYELEEHAEAEKLLHKSLATSRALQDEVAIVDTLYCLGSLAYQRGSLTEAEEYYKESLAICEVLGGLLEKASVLNGLGLVAFEQGRKEEAGQLYEESLRIREQTGEREGQSETLFALGVFYHEQGAYVKASAYYDKSLELSTRLGTRYARATIFTALGRLEDAQERTSLASNYYSDAVSIWTEIGHVHRLSHIHSLLEKARQAPPESSQSDMLPSSQPSDALIALFPIIDQAISDEEIRDLSPSPTPKTRGYLRPYPSFVAAKLRIE